MLTAANDRWKNARLITGGDFDGGSRFDLMVVWANGTMSNFADVSTTGLGTEHRVLNTNTTWTGATVMTTGHYTANTLVDDIVARWADGHTTMFADSTLDRLGTERVLVPAGS